MAGKDDDIVSLVLQGKKEFEAMLKENESLRIKCYALEMQCERLEEERKGLHTGASHHRQFQIHLSDVSGQRPDVYPLPLSPDDGIT